LNAFAFGAGATSMTLERHEIAAFLGLPMVDSTSVGSNLVIATCGALRQRDTPHAHLRRKNQLAYERHSLTLGLTDGDYGRVDQDVLKTECLLNRFQEPRLSTLHVSNAGTMNVKIAMLVGFTKENQLHKFWESEGQLGWVDFVGTES